MDIMKAILDIEDKAQEVMNTLESLKAENDDLINRELEQEHLRMEAEADEKINAHKEAIEESLHSQAEELQKLAKEKKEKLENTYREMRAAWVSELTEFVIKGSGK